MNKKLILAAIAVTLSVGCAQATNITGVSKTNGVYNIEPEHYSGVAAYRKYDNFVLSENDVAHLNFKDREGKTTSAFVNLVGSKVQINGLLNSVKEVNGATKFYNGHAIFITPGGFVVGESGVINVGRLSVATPTSDTYNNKLLKYDGKDYGDPDFNYADAIGRRVSKLTYNNNSNLPAGAAEVTINGKVFATQRVEATGSTVTVGGNIVNGVKRASSENPITSASDAADLFSSLVNTNGTINDASKFDTSSGRIRLKSESGMTVSGTVTNNKEVYLSNAGSNGLAVSGGVTGSTYARLYNTKGNLAVGSGAYINSAKVDARNQSGSSALTLASGSTLNGTSKVQIKNQGSGELKAEGAITGKGTYVIKNVNGSSMTVDGTITNTQGQTAIRNYKGALTVNGKITNSNGNMGIINTGSGATITKNAQINNTGKLKIANTGSSGMKFVGDVTNNGELRIYNDGGKLSFETDSAGTKAAQITNQNGKLYVAARKNATGLSQSAESNIENTKGNVVIRNSGTQVASGAKGLDLQGGVAAKTSGTVAINNDKGDMYVASNIQVANGDLGIINRAGGADMTLANAGTINVKGNANVKNLGSGDMAVNSEITHTGRFNVLDNSGALTLGSKVHNNSTGALDVNNGFYAVSRKNGTGVTVSSTFAGDGSGEYLIKNISGANGLTYSQNASITSSANQAALVNHKGTMTVAGKMKTTGAPIIVSSKGDKLTVTSTANLNSGTTGNLFVHLDSTGDPSVSSSATLTNMEGHGKLKGKI